MNNLKFKTVLTIALLVFSWPSFAKAPVWKVSKGDDYLYIGGTIHVLSKNDYPLPGAFEEAFDDAAKLIFETDIAAMSLPQNQAKFSGALQYQDERTLKTVLDTQTYARLVEHLAKRKIPIDDFSKFTPGGLSIVLTMLELQALGITAAGVDEHFSSRAEQASKTTGFLESIDEQIGFLENFSTLDPNKLINSSLRDLADLQGEWEKMLDSWRSGNITELEEVVINEMQDEFPSLYQFILVERNNRWIEKIKVMLTTQEIEFLLVGALHLAGDDSVLKQLSDSGYSVKQLD